MWICRKHKKPLQALKREFQSKDLRQWLLPEDINDSDWDKLIIDFPTVQSKLLWVADLSVHIAKRRANPLDRKLLRFSYLLRAKKRDWLFTDGSVKLAQLREAFIEYYRGTDNIPGFEVIQTASAGQGGMIGLLMRQYKGHRHPAKHILLMAFLYDSVSEFDADYEVIFQTYTKGGIEGLEELVGESWKSELKHLVEVEHKSLVKAAKSIGIPLCVALRVAKQNSILYKRRVRVAKTELEIKIIEMIGDGLGRDVILKETGIKKSLLKDLMARNPELRNTWRQKNFDCRRDSYRANYLQKIKLNQGASIKKIRLIPGNGVSWLHRNDRRWLLGHLPNNLINQ
jgi:uncharacterized protein YnzC (UPF0291/DUF896 family)